MLLCLVLAACGTPIEVQRVDARAVQTELTSNAVSTGRLSGSSQIVLHRQDLEPLYAEVPADGIKALHRIVAAGNAGQDEMFALAEMAFLEGERTSDRSYALAAVIYAYAFLFPTDPTARPNPFDPRLRAAAGLDLSSTAIANGRINGRLVLYPGGDPQQVTIAGQQVPLESEPSAALAYSLSIPEIWRAEVTGTVSKIAAGSGAYDRRRTEQQWRRHAV
jgi:hypothetical protein